MHKTESLPACLAYPCIYLPLKTSVLSSWLTWLYICFYYMPICTILLPNIFRQKLFWIIFHYTTHGSFLCILLYDYTMIPLISNFWMFVSPVSSHLNSFSSCMCVIAQIACTFWIHASCQTDYLTHINADRLIAQSTHVLSNW